MGDLVPVGANDKLHFSADEQKLIRDTIAPGLTELEFKLFLYTSQNIGLNPLRRQIYAVKRKQWDSETRSYIERMTIQTGIDGFRAVSFRNGKTLPGREPTFDLDPGAKSKSNPIGLVSATAYLKVYGNDGNYHEVSATAYWDEYCPINKDGAPQAMWGKMPRVMLSKCAEAILHRKCNPEDLSGVYTNDEMQQADNTNVIDVSAEPVVALPVMSDLNKVKDEPKHPLPVAGNEVEQIGETITIEEKIDHDIDKVQKVFPEAKVVNVKRKGKFGFLDEVGALKTTLRDRSGNDELYYSILATIGPGTYKSAKEIDDRKEQVAFWKGLKTAVNMTASNATGGER